MAAAKIGLVSQVKDWLQLIRLPAAMTLVADVLAAVVITAPNSPPWVVMGFAIAASLAFYWAGMILNDVNDIEEDRQQRSKRPLAAGRISLQVASRVGWAFLALGVLIVLVAGQVCVPGVVGLVPGAIALLLALLIFLYDGPLKHNIVAPWIMGSCRGVNWLMVSSLVMVASRGELDAWPWQIWPIALGMFFYIAGVTWFARREAVQSDRFMLIFGSLWVIVGLGILVMFPPLSPMPTYYIDPAKVYPIVIVLVGAGALRRFLVAISRPEPLFVQLAVKNALLSMIMLDATVALLVGGPNWGIAVCAFVLPALLLGFLFRTT